jgi:hypothetical protein
MILNLFFERDYNNFDELVNKLTNINTGIEVININVDNQITNESNEINLSQLKDIVKLCNENDTLKKIKINFRLEYINIDLQDKIVDSSENLNIYFYSFDKNIFLKINEMYPHYNHLLHISIDSNIDFLDIINNCNINKSKNVKMTIINLNKDLNQFSKEELDSSLDLFFNNTNNKIYLNCRLYTNLLKYLVIKIQDLNDLNRFNCMSADLPKDLQQIKNKTNKQNSRIKSITLINTTNYEDIYKFFLENYKKSFFLPYKNAENSVKRAELYIKSIMDYVFNSMIFKRHNFTSDKFVKYLIKKSFEFKESVKLEYDRNDSNRNNSIKLFVPNKTILTAYHGNPTTDLVEVPKDCIICFITPINYIETANNDKIPLLLKECLTLSTFPKTFKMSPHCYMQNAPANHQGTFTNSNTFLPGQYYNDIELSWNNEDFAGTLGTYLINYENEDLPYYYKYIKNNYMTESKPTKKLSELIIQEKLSGIIIVLACRSIELKDNSTIIYRYEHFCNILNKSTWFFDNQKNYYKCGPNTLSIKDNSFEKVSEYYRKSTNTKLQRIVNRINRQTIKRENEGNRSLGFRQKLPYSIGLSEEVLKILFDTIKDKDKINNNLLDTFNQLDALFTKQSYNPTLLEKLSKFLKKIYESHGEYVYYINQITRNLKFGSDFNIIDIFISFVLYMCAVKKNEFYCHKFAPDIDIYIYITNIHLSGCKLTTEDFENLIPYLFKIDTQYSLISLYLNNNEITKIPFNLFKTDFFKINLDNNPLDFNVDSKNPDRYLNEFHYIDEEKEKYDYGLEQILDSLSKYFNEWKTINRNRNTNNNWKTIVSRKKTNRKHKNSTKLNRTNNRLTYI